MGRKVSASAGNRSRGLRAVASELAALRRHAKSVGVFTHERELLECGCGLLEDVTTGGILITCQAATPGHDTGLRFRQLRENRFQCPSCSATVVANQNRRTR